MYIISMMDQIIYGMPIHDNLILYMWGSVYCHTIFCVRACVWAGVRACRGVCYEHVLVRVLQNI